MKCSQLFILFTLVLAQSAYIYADLGDFVVANPTIPEGSINLKDCGGVADGKTDNSAAFKLAVYQLTLKGGGTLNVTPGVWYTLPFDLASNINLHIEEGAKILFSPHFEDYTSSKSKYRPLLFTHEAHDVKISGKGVIDGNGSAWWPEAKRFKADALLNHRDNNTSPRPRMVVFDRCKRVSIDGVTLINSPVFNVVPTLCEDVTISNVTIFNPPDALNTDGIDPSVSKRVLITNCNIDTGDDNIAVKSGSSLGASCQDIIITDCTFGHGHGCSIGSETYSGVRHMIVRRCSFSNTTIGVRFKSDRRKGGLVEDVTYEDLSMKNVGQAIVISSYYQGSTTDITSDIKKSKKQQITRTTPHWKNITLKNIFAVEGTKDAGMILGLPEMPAESIKLENISIEAPKGLRLSYTKDITFKAVSIKQAHGNALIIDDTNTELKQSNE